MKTTLYRLLSLLLLLSCGKGSNTLSPDLAKAEALMKEHPDSALAVLHSMPIPSPSDKENYATWCLLLTQAQDKNHIRHTTDSLIQVALHHFEKQPDLRRQAMAFYYAGRVQDDLQNKEAATQYYVQAFDRAEQAADYRFMALASNYLGRLYHQMDLKEKALEQQFISYTADSLARDTIGVIYSLREIGTCYLHLGKLDSALHFYQNALSLSGHMKDTLAGALLNNVAIVYREQNQTEQSILYFRKAIEKTTRQTNLYATDFALGCAYLMQQQLDSAAAYLTKSTQSSNLYTKTGSYTRLYDLEKLRGNYKLAATYNDLYLQYRDSVDNMELKKSVAEIESKYDYEKQQDAIKNLKLKKSRQAWIYVCLVFVLLCAIMLIYVIFQKRLIEKDEELQKYKKKLQMYSKQLENNERQIKENQVQIISNRKKTDGLLATNKSIIEEKQQENKELIKQNEELRLQINTTRKHLIQTERHTVERLALKDPILKPLILCKHKKEEYTQKNWDEVVITIDCYYDGIITKLKHFFPSLSKNDILELSLLLINFRNTEIAYVTGADVGVNTMHKRIERLAKKIKAPQGEDMISYILDDLRELMSTNVDNGKK